VGDEVDGWSVTAGILEVLFRLRVCRVDGRSSGEGVVFDALRCLFLVVGEGDGGL
jgi:hypothetical protein